MTCKKSFGFTLIELLIVVAVGAILIVVALISLNGIQEKGRDAKRINDITNIQQVMKIIEEKELITKFIETSTILKTALAEQNLKDAQKKYQELYAPFNIGFPYKSPSSI